MKNSITSALSVFATTIYIIVVNPQILSMSGIDFESAMAATTLTMFLGTLLMGAYGRYPFAIGPGMGLNAYFTFGIVEGAGFSWQEGLAICCASGILLLALNALGLRELILTAIPPPLRNGTTAGIGLFLAFIGFQNLGIVAAHCDTLVTLGDIKTPAILLSGMGLALTAGLLARNWKGGILAGIALISCSGWFLSLSPFNGIWSFPPSVEATFMQLDFAAIINPASWSIIITLIFVCLFDTVGTVHALTWRGGFTDGYRAPNLRKAMACDAAGTIIGSILGTSPSTIYLESAAGFSAGGKGPLTAIVVAFLFLTALFFSPLIASIPLWATAPALIIVGILMTESVKLIIWEDFSESVPACVAMAGIPLTFSIADGIGLSFILYPFIKLFAGKVKEVPFLLWLIALFFIGRFIWL